MKRILLAVCLSIFCFGASAKVEETAIRVFKSGDISWVRQPRIQFNNDELQGYDRTVLVGFSANESGFITSTEVVESSGLDAIDKKVIMAVKRAKVKPYQVNGVSYPFTVKQPYTLKFSRTFEYEIEPQIIVKKSLLLEGNRSVAIYFEADGNGNLIKAEVLKGSTVPEIDAYVLSEFKKQAKFKPRIVDGKPDPIKETAWFYFGEGANTKD